MSFGGCRHSVIVRTPCLSTSDDGQVISRIKKQYERGNLRILAISGNCSWDRRHEGALRFRQLDSSFGSIASSLNPTLVVGLGANAHFATAAFLWADKPIIRQLICDYAWPLGRSVFTRHCTLPASARMTPKMLYQRLAVALSDESQKGRLLLTQFVDAASGITYIADLTQIASTIASPYREECLEEILRSSVSTRVGRQGGHQGAIQAISGAVSRDNFQRIFVTLAAIVDLSPHGSGSIKFQLIDIPDECGPRGCTPDRPQSRSLDIAMRALMRDSKERLASVGARFAGE
jgi:hypothetical protein